MTPSLPHRARQQALRSRILRLTAAAVVLALPVIGITVGAGSGGGSTTAAAAATRPACPPKAAAPVTPKTSYQRWQPRFPIRAAFYYGWGAKSSHYHPSYGSDDPCVNPGAPSRTVYQMRFAGMNAGISSWWGPHSASDVRFPAQLRAADGSHFRWTLYYEPAGHTAAKISSDLGYLMRRYAHDRSYLRVGGRPVLFVWAGGSNNCALTHRWVSANHGRFYLVLKNYYRMSTCRYHGSDWHAYGPASRTLSVPGHSYSISPGFWRNGDRRPVLGRDIHAWDRAIQKMIASRAHWQLITTFNEWGENTAIESAREWRTGSHKGRYADLLHIHLHTTG